MSILKQDGGFLFQERGESIKQFASETISSTTGNSPDQIKKDWNAARGGIEKTNVALDDVYTPLANKADQANRKLKENIIDGRSIIARAKNSVLQFPVYIVQTCRVNEAHILSKFFEKVYVNYVQTWLSMNQIISEDEANNLAFLKNFHSNLKESVENLINPFYEPIDECDEMMQHAIHYEERISENCIIEFTVDRTPNPILIAENARLLNDPLAGLNDFFEAAKTKRKPEKKKQTIFEPSVTEPTTVGNTETTTKTDHNISNLSEEDFKQLAMNELNFSPAQRRLISAPDVKSLNTPELRANYVKYNSQLDQRIQDIKNTIKRESNDPEIMNGTKQGKYNGRYMYSNGRFVRVDTVNSSVTKTSVSSEGPKTPQLLKNGDLKKLNGMEPWQLDCTFRIKTNNGLDRDIHFIIGVKTVLHMIRTQDLAEDLEELVTGNIKSLRKVKYKTGEINFMNYVFNTKAIKADATKHINHNKRWINSLKRLAEYNKLSGTLFKKPAALVNELINSQIPFPNATLILTQSDVSMLTAQTGIDISEVGNAKRLAKSLFLIAIAIVDQAAGSMKVLFDEEGSWDVQSLSSIEAEMAKTDNSKLMSELNKMVNR